MTATALPTFPPPTQTTKEAILEIIEKEIGDDFVFADDVREALLRRMLRADMYTLRFGFLAVKKAIEQKTLEEIERKNTPQPNLRDATSKEM